MVRNIAALHCALTVGFEAHAEPASAPIPVKVVVSMFELGKPTGDAPGEYRFWVGRQKLDHIYPFPLGEYDLHMNDQGLLGICTGGGTSNATSSIMALGLDPRFDLSKAYRVITGFAGGDPQDVSLSTAAWARHVVDGDLLYEMVHVKSPPNGPTACCRWGPSSRTENPPAGRSIPSISRSTPSWPSGPTPPPRITRWPTVPALRRSASSTPDIQMRCDHPS